MTISQFLLRIRFTRDRPSGVSEGRWKGMLKFLEHHPIKEGEEIEQEGDNPMLTNWLANNAP